MFDINFPSEALMDCQIWYEEQYEQKKCIALFPPKFPHDT